MSLLCNEFSFLFLSVPFFSCLVCSFLRVIHSVSCLVVLQFPAGYTFGFLSRRIAVSCGLYIRFPVSYIYIMYSRTFYILYPPPLPSSSARGWGPSLPCLGLSYVLGLGSFIFKFLLPLLPGVWVLHQRPVPSSPSARGFFFKSAGYSLPNHRRTLK